MGSHPAGSAMQKNWVSSPIRRGPSSTGSPIIRSAASQVAPQGAPRITRTAAILPSVISTSNSGAPKRSPYLPRPACLGSPHQVGGFITHLLLIFFPEAMTGIPFSAQRSARSSERSLCLRKSRTRSVSSSRGRNCEVSSRTGGSSTSRAKSCSETG